MLSDSRGRLWLGYGNNKIIERKDGIYHALPITDGPWGNTLAFYEAADTLWAGGSSGLCFLDGEHWRRVHSLGADLLKGTSGIVLDKLNNLWLNAGSGVLRIPAGEVARVLQDHQHR